LQPATPSQGIAIGGSGNTAGLDITASELAQFQDGFRSIAIGRTNGSGSVVIQSASFNDPVAVRSPAGDITVNGAVSGNGGITLNASTLNLNSELSNTGGELNLTGDTQITNAVNLSNTGNISLSGAINGSGSLNITAGSSDVTFGGAIGSITPLEQITVTAGNVTVNGAVATTNGITLDSPVTVSNSGGTFNAGTGSLALSSSLTSQFQDLIFTGSEIDLGGRLSGSGQVFLQPANPSTNIAVGGSGTTTGLDLTATELANFGSGFRSVTIGQTDGSGNITIGSTSLPVPTTILSPTGAIALDGTITSTGGLTLTAPTLTLNAASIDNTTGPVNLQGQTEINNAVNITNNGNITLTSAVDGSGELTLDSGSGNVLLRGAVGSSSPLQQLTLNGNLATVNGAVATTNGITLNSPIELGANGGNFSAGSGPLTLGSTLTANTQNLTLTANDINLGGVVRGIGNLVLEPTNPSQSMAIGDANANAEFTLTAADIANLQDGFTGVTIGRSDGSGTVAIANITLPDPTIVQVPLEPGSISVTGNTTLVGNGSLTLIAPQTQLGGNITSENGNIALNSDAIQLSNDVTLSTQDAGNITLSGTINGANQLTLNAGGNVELGNSLGNITALTGLTVRGQNLALNGDITTNQGNVSIDAPISLQRDTAVITGSDATGYGDVTATSTIDGNYRLLINAGNVRVDGAIGGNEPLESVTIVAEPEINLQDVTTDGGDVDLQAVDDIITGDIITTPSTPLPAGDITLTSTEGGVTTGNLDASGPGTGGNIAIAGDRDIITGDITTSSDSASAGDITVTSHQGSITTQDIRAESLGLTSGTLNLDAGNSINTGNINQSGGNIRLRAAQTITTGNISSRSETGPGGQVELEANGDITTGDITTNGFLNAGNVLINSILGNITTGNILSTSTQGAGGTVDLNAAGNVSTGTINTSGEVEAGVVNLVSAGGGTISTGNITALSELGGPGEVNISTSGEVNTGVIKVTPEQPRSPEESTRIEPASDLPPQAAENVPTTEETVTDAPSTNPSAEPPAEPAVATSELPGIETEPEIETATPAVVVPPAIAPTEVLQPPPQPVQSPEPEATTPVPAAVEEHHIPPTDSGHSEIAPMETAPDAVIAMPEGNIAQDLIPSSQPLEIVTNPGNVQTPQSTVVNNPVSTSQILDIARYNLNQNLASGNLVDAVGGIEEMRSQEFADYFGSEFQEVPTSLQGIRDSLGNITRETGSTPGIIYTLVQPEQLELILITANGAPIRRTVATDRETLLQAVTAFRGELTTPNRRHSQNYLRSAQQLYQWLIAPIQPELEANGIDTLLFSMDSGLRALPIAALHDGEQFLIEKYPIALIPSISLTNMRYRSLANTRVLAMGASTFTELNPLPAVPVELSTITEQLWQGVQLLNADFTRANLMATRHDYPYEIIHLATHGEFNSGALSNSYIQLWDEKLGLDQLRTLGWQNPQVELLVLSACRTALGDEKAELGFAGFAVQAGVKTAIASLWYVSDEGTLALMSEFYRQLSTAPLKAEALRQAQIAMIRGNVQIENGILRFRGESEGISLPPEFFATQTTLLSHPYYWSAFTTIGSPW
jgi:CHAT domain-containing protein